MAKQLILAATLAAALSACSMAPTYERPQNPVSVDFPQGEAYGTASAPAATAQKQTLAADIGWHDFFADARLQKLIEIALVNNRDYRVATLQVEKARAQYQIQRADLFPTVNAAAGQSRSHTPADLSSTGTQFTGGSYSAGLGFTAYELDLFGRVQSLKNEALESYFSTAEAQRASQITLVSEVASQYLTLLAAQEQLQLAQDTLSSYQHTLDLTQKRFDVGASSAIELAVAQTQVNTAQGSVASSTLQAAQAENGLVLLIGEPLPAQLPAAQTLGTQGLLTDLPAGVPSDLLERRPDILQAEHTLKAANADIGAARANFFPRITLTGSYGTSSAELGNLFKAGQTAWSFAPSITLPIFDAGRNKATLDVSTTSEKIAVAQYEKSIQSAFREVSDALAARNMLDLQINAQQALVKSETTRYDLSTLRFTKGVDSYLAALDAQRSLFTAEQNLITLRLSRLTNLVTLYKVLGGGWVAQTGETPLSPGAAS
ncbi:efflux transporter outer membrane subunit [Silvimonas soli]|uniref:efflux transporter outer membrane subunit n=1 Tax=Silvimonas soli TaxID=2980100 RepID=UPI0024B3B2DF|nr:efflux transporter outer membrane subunit [Silvimonas soli]